MGKYDTIWLKTRDNNPKTELLFVIANELAEMNRLKRLELKALFEIKYEMPKSAQEAREDRA